MTQHTSELHSSERPFAKNWPLHIMIAVFVITWTWLAIHPVERKDWMLENVLPVLSVIVLAFMYRRFAFSNLSYLLILIFLILHLIGAHYAYRNSPVDFWFKQTFHTERGIFDRIVHFSFGLLLIYPGQEALLRIVKARYVWISIIAFAMILAGSAIFEVVEMVVTLLTQLINPQLGADYMGLQGDPLDSQKDISMALLGALLTSGSMLYFHNVGNKPKQ